MAKPQTACTLVESVKRRAMVPQDQCTFSKQDILDIINEEHDIGLMASILKVHEEYYLRTDYIPLESGVVRYKIPYRSVGNKLRDLQYKDIDDNLYEMTRISIESVSDYQNYLAYNRFRTFYLEGDEVVLLSSDCTLTGSLAFSYYVRPNELVTNCRAGVVTSVCVCSGRVNLANLPTNITGGINIDIIDSRSPNKLREFDIPVVTVSTVSPISITVDVDISACTNPCGYVQAVLNVDALNSIVVGDYINNEGETIVPQLPTELTHLLAQRAAVYILEAQGDQQSYQLASNKLAEMERNILSLIDNRVEGAPQKIVNRHSTLRAALSRGNYTRGS